MAKECLFILLSRMSCEQHDSHQFEHDRDHLHRRLQRSVAERKPYSLQTLLLLLLPLLELLSDHSHSGLNRSSADFVTERRHTAVQL